MLLKIMFPSTFFRKPGVPYSGDGDKQRYQLIESINTKTKLIYGKDFVITNYLVNSCEADLHQAFWRVNGSIPYPGLGDLPVFIYYDLFDISDVKIVLSNWIKNQKCEPIELIFIPCQIYKTQ